MNALLLDQLKKITAEEQKLLDGRAEIDKSIYMQKDSAEVDWEHFLEKGKLITLRPHTRFAYFPKHTHNYVEMVYMCQGSTRHRINDSEVVIKEGEILILNQNATQEIYPAGESDIAVNFIIWPQFFDTAIHLIAEEENLIRKFLVNCLRGQKSEMGYLHFEVSDILPIQNLIENLIWTLVQHQPNSRSMNQLTMGLLFLHLADYTDKLKSVPIFEKQQLMLQVLRFIEENYKDGKLSDLADELHYNVWWLSREISRQAGKTYTELLQDKRMSQAAYLLKTTTMKVAEVGETVGYENISYFHRIFQKYYKISPHKFRCK